MATFQDKLPTFVPLSCAHGIVRLWTSGGFNGDPVIQSYQDLIQYVSITVTYFCPVYIQNIQNTFINNGLACLAFTWSGVLDTISELFSMHVCIHYVYIPVLSVECFTSCLDAKLSSESGDESEAD